MQKTVQKFLRWLGNHVYGAFFPVEGGSVGMERYLEDLWHEAPLSVALTHTMLAIFVQFSPILFIGRFALLSQLKLSERETLQKRILHSKWYLFRLIGYGVRGHAMVAALRHKETRKRALRSPLLEQRTVA
jgi:hypothetical protein